MQKKKERRIVTWTPEEDDMLREQIGIHGTDNWTLIASKFEDKTTRQCRRRWYTYLNSDFKRGGWSLEEDNLLCEAQKIFGNRWTEIAKVVSGRTDNAVKNRFTTLCKKRAKCDALAKENSATYINANNKRSISDSNVLDSQGLLHVTSPLKKMRIAHIPTLLDTCNIGSQSDKDCTGKKQLRRPFAVLAQNREKIDTLQPQHQVAVLEALIDGSRKFEGFLNKDDPKILGLMQQADLLSSLAMKVNTENTEKSMENAWKVLENFLNQSKDGVVTSISNVDLQLDKLKDLVDLICCNTENQPSQGQPDLYDSPSSSDYSTCSTILSNNASAQIEQTQSEMCTLSDDAGARLQKIGAREEVLLPCAEAKNDEDVSAFSAIELSPPQVTPVFRSFAATIPSPQFSESERHFLMKTLGINSPAPSRSTDSSHSPPCRSPGLPGQFIDLFRSVAELQPSKLDQAYRILHAKNLNPE